MGSDAYYADEWHRLNSRYNRARDADPLIDGWRKSRNPDIQRRFENLMQRIGGAD